MRHLIVLFLLLVTVSAQTAVTDYVVDQTGVFTPQEKATLIAQLKSLESKTNGVQFVVFVTDAIPIGYDLESYALKIAESNKIGKKGADNGILFFLAVKDRKYRWEVGYGVESTLNAALLGRISRNYLDGPFKAGNYAEGIFAGVAVVEKILLNSSDPDIQKLKQEEDDITGLYIFLAIVVVFILIAWFSRKAGSQQSSSWGNHVYIGAGSAVGGFRGGSSGGFSGGGGSFGGGGHSGSF